jgi:hypothetical protein
MAILCFTEWRDWSQLNSFGTKPKKQSDACWIRGFLFHTVMFSPHRFDG